MLIATVAAEQRDEVLAQAAGAAAHADLIELRLDRIPFRPGELPELLARLPLPAIVSCRRVGDGGDYAGSESDRVELLRQAAREGAAWIDVEWRSAAEALIDGEHGVRVLLSHHDHETTPADVGEIGRMLRTRPGADLVKLVTRARSLEDNLVLRDLLRQGAGGTRLAAFCLGSAGVASRVLGPAWGSAATYGSAGPAPVAPGQLPVADLATRYRVRSLGPGTRVLGVVGHPLSHSLSPAVHNAALAHLGLDAVYLPLPSQDVEPVLALGKGLPLDGFSVTSPLKEAIVRHLDSVDPAARRIGAVNTVIVRDGRWHGVNTDVAAAVEPLVRRLDLRDRGVALLGAGGAARALAHGLTARGARVTVFSRRASRGRALAREVEASWRRLEELETEPYDVLVQATPVGMEPHPEAMPIPAAWLRGELVYDIVYNPRETALLAAARRKGIATLGGIEMFLAQAAAQFRHFTGQGAPLDVMRRAAEAEETPNG